jgi:hypothetical protein
VSALNLSSGLWQHADDPQPGATGGGGSPWPELGDLIAARYDIPVGIVAVGVGATRVGQWQPGGHYSRIENALAALSPYGYRAILWHQGESDSLAGTDAATYASLLQNIIAESRIDAGFDVPWGVALASWHPNSSAANEAEVIAGQQLVIDSDPLVFLGSETDSFHTHVPSYLADSVHFNTLGLNAHALQWLTALEPLLIIPEPSTFLIWALGLLGLVWRGRRRTK